MFSDKKKADKQLLRYAGMATQFLVSIGIGVFLGLKIDQWCKFSMPLIVWILPLLIIIGLIVGIIKETSKKNNETSD